MRNAGKRCSTTSAPCGAALPPLERSSSPDGVPPRFSPKGVIVPKAQLQARLPGTWSVRALPAFACPSPASTSRPGHNAGRLLPKPPGRGLQVRPRAPPSLLWPGMPPDHVLYVSEDAHVTEAGTYVKGIIAKIVTSFAGAVWQHPFDDHSITSSARPSSVIGKVRPIALATFRLTMNA